jgi:predicted ArsR family transcriptional regulator
MATLADVIELLEFRGPMKIEDIAKELHTNPACIRTAMAQEKEDAAKNPVPIKSLDGKTLQLDR